jgi:hypothetical protein
MKAPVGHSPGAYSPRFGPLSLLPIVLLPALSPLLQPLGLQAILDFLRHRHYFPALLLIEGPLNILKHFQPPLLHVPHPAHERPHSQLLLNSTHIATPPHIDSVLRSLELAPPPKLNVLGRNRTWGPLLQAVPRRFPRPPHDPKSLWQEVVSARGSSC